MEINPGREYDMPSPEPLRPDEEIRSLKTIVDYQSGEMKKLESRNKELLDMLGEITFNAVPPSWFDKAKSLIEKHGK